MKGHGVYLPTFPSFQNRSGSVLSVPSGSTTRTSQRNHFHLLLKPGSGQSISRILGVDLSGSSTWAVTLHQGIQVISLHEIVDLDPGTRNCPWPRVCHAFPRLATSKALPCRIIRREERRNDLPRIGPVLTWRQDRHILGAI